MDARWRTLFDTLAETQFADVAGTRLSVTLPVADRLLTAIARDRVPASAPIRDLDIRAEAGDRLAVRLRVSRPSFLPPFTIRLQIEQQPELPSRPVLRLRIVSQGFGALAGLLTRFVTILPPWIDLRDDRLSVELAGLARHYGMADLFRTVTALTVTTRPGAVVVDLSAALPPPA